MKAKSRNSGSETNSESRGDRVRTSSLSIEDIFHEEMLARRQRLTQLLRLVRDQYHVSLPIAPQRCRGSAHKTRGAA